MSLPAALAAWSPLRRLDALAAALLEPPGVPRVDFAAPPGEPALMAPDSVSWRVMKNPVALLAGGVAAVILELAHPAVRAGVWEHSDFRTDPVGRVRRTGLAAMVTVYGPRSVARPMIAGVRRAHARVRGTLPSGAPYAADDPALLAWVQGTATFGFTEAHHRLVHPLSAEERGAAFAEALPAARLYGAHDAPGSWAAWEAMLEGARGVLEPSPVVGEFVRVMAAAPLLPGPLRPLQGPILRCAAGLVPPWVRARLGLAREPRPGEERLVRAVGALADRVPLRSAPPARACVRLGLPEDHLFTRRS